MDREKKRIYDKAYRQANRERRRLVKQAWRQANPDKAADERLHLRSRERGAVMVERVERKRLFRRDEGCCHICDKMVDPNNWHVDHVIPIFKGGEHSYANTAVSHPECNRKKVY